MINTFLFDLDGTLLPMEPEVFEVEYFNRLADKLSDHFSKDELIKYIWKSTLMMVKGSGGRKTNKEVFFDDFIKTTNKDMDILGPIFDEFYLKEFKELGRLVKSEDYIIKTIDTLIERGYDIVVATNPIFPLAAIKERLNWAGLGDKPFKYITCYEEMHYCKPNVKFYEELLHKIGKTGEECIMVGNDVEEDLAAAKIGIKTFLLENYIINRENIIPEADYRGYYEDLYRLVLDNFPAIKKAV